MNKQLLIIFLIIMSPIIAQETQQKNKKELYIETGIFTRIEGLTSQGNIEAPPVPISLTALEFSIGRENIYLYSQLRFSTVLPDYRKIKSGIIYGRRIGFLVGLGGKIYDSRPDQVEKKFTMAMNLGVGGDFPLDKVFHDIPFGPPIGPFGEIVFHDYLLNNYFTAEWNWMMKYHFKKNFGLQWGVNVAISSDFYQNTNPDILSTNIDLGESLIIRYGFSLGFVF